MPAAAAVPLSSAAGMVQKTGCAPSRKNRPTASAPIAATGETTVESAKADGGEGQRDRHVELALAGAIGMARDEYEADDRHRVGDRGHEALADVAEAADLVDDLADPERQPVDVDDHAEVQEAEDEHATVLEGVADRVAIALQARRLLALQAPRQPLLLVGPQPGRLGGAVVEVAPHEDAAQDGRHGLDQEQPLPVLQARVPSKIDMIAPESGAPIA